MSDPDAGLLGELQTTMDGYVAAWRRTDHDAVLSYITPDVVLLPHDGLAPLVGREAARDFWFGGRWPPGGIERFDIRLLGAHDRSGTAVAWGTRHLEYWQTEDGLKVTYAWDGTLLLVFESRAPGWAITHFMWDDPPAQRTVVSPIDPAP